MPIARGARIGIVGTVFAGMLGVAGFGAYNVFSSLNGGSGSGGGGGTSHTAAAPAVTTPPSAAEVSRAAQDFLGAWSSGDIAKAAKLTDSLQTATDALTGYTTSGHITSVQATAQPATGTRVPFTVSAHISYQGLSTVWTYTSALTVGRDLTNDPAVKWAPTVLHPDLTEGDTIVTGPAQAPDIEVVDRDGKELTAAAYPSLTRIIEDLKKRYAGELTGGTPGIETFIEKPDGSQGKTLDVLKKGKARTLPTTLDAGYQAAAEKAVAGKSKAGTVALNTSTGAILAIAYSPASGTDWALQEKAAPGSTFKIVTSAALLEHGMSPRSASPCIEGYAVHGQRAMHNDDAMNNPGASLLWDFKESCNTGFTRHAPEIGSSGLLHAAAQFGLDQTWNVGTPAADPSVPGGSGDELTAEMIGQGRVQLSPLTVASIAATARQGSFHQPHIVAPSMIEGKLATAPGIPSGVSASLRTMMHATVTNGTATGVMNGLGSDSGAKTGSAEVDGQATANGWFTAYAGHVAAAAVVEDAGHGNTSAGPIVARVLRAG